jgi:hypothetical protein
MLDDAYSRRNRIIIMARAYIDLPITVSKQQLIYAGETMQQDIPTYIKRNTLIGGALVAPFVLSLCANGIDKLAHHQTLYHSWLWRTPWLALWVLYLPMVALALAITSVAITLLCWDDKTNESAWWFAIFRRSWPVLLIGCFALFILLVVFGHDSVHCITGNPVREMQQWHSTLHCVQQR